MSVHMTLLLMSAHRTLLLMSAHKTLLLMSAHRTLLLFVRIQDFTVFILHYSCPSLNLFLSRSNNSHCIAFKHAPSFKTLTSTTFMSSYHSIFSLVGQKMAYSVFKSLLPSIQNKIIFFFFKSPVEET
jgi:hypothetical protein